MAVHSIWQTTGVKFCSVDEKTHFLIMPCASWVGWVRETVRETNGRRFVCGLCLSVFATSCHVVCGGCLLVCDGLDCRSGMSSVGLEMWRLWRCLIGVVSFRDRQKIAKSKPSQKCVETLSFRVPHLVRKMSLVS